MSTRNLKTKTGMDKKQHANDKRCFPENTIAL